MKEGILQLDLMMDTSMYIWIILFSVSGPVIHLLLQMNFQTAF